MIDDHNPRRPNPASPNEIIRRMPRGIRTAILTPGPLDDQPAPILGWLTKYELIRPHQRNPQHLARTRLCDQVVRQLNQRMKGRTP